MAIELNAVEARVLAVLVEKSITTPDNYPLTTNALRLGCNQKSNRNPVVDYGDNQVDAAVSQLMRMHLVLTKGSAEHRVTRYAHRFEAVMALTASQAAVLCTLMLRGPQTVGEIRSHCMRLFAFDNTAQVVTIIEELSAHPTMQFISKLPRQTGCKECRYVHLLTDRESLLDDIEKYKEIQPAVVKQSQVDVLSEVKDQIVLLRQEILGLKKALSDVHPELAVRKDCLSNGKLDIEKRQ